MSTPAASSFSSLLQHLSPDQAVGMGTAGLLLIFLEFNRPGRVYAGSLGLLLFLLAAAALLHADLRLASVLLLALSGGLFLLNLYRAVPAGLLALSTLGFILGLRLLVRSPAGRVVHLVLAVLCGGTAGITSAVLTRIAHRARAAKALN